MENDKISTSVHAAAGAFSGYVSNFMGQPSHALAIALVILFFTLNVSKQLIEGEDGKWWIGNGVVPFLLLWAVFSILFYNL